MMNKGSNVVLGVFLLLIGVTVLGYWGASHQAVTMQASIDSAAQQVAETAIHPMQVRVSGRDITLTGTADSQAELDRLTAGLDAIAGRRVVNTGDVTILPDVTPYETALAKGLDGSVAVTGYLPTEAARDALGQAGLPVASLPMAHGAPEGWLAAVQAGAAALAPLENGSFSLTGTNLTLQGTAATPLEAAAARQALDGLTGFDPAVSLDVLDPGLVEFGLDWNAASGMRATGIVPKSLGLTGIAKALGLRGGIAGEVGETFAELPGLTDSLTALGPLLAQFDSAQITGAPEGLSLSGEALPGIDPVGLAGKASAALGSNGSVLVNPGPTPTEGASRVNAATGLTETAIGGYWIASPDFKATKPDCTAAALAATAASPIRFVTGSAELDPASIAVINRLAGIVRHCTEAPGMHVVIGGHTDAEGDDTANYVLSLARARAVRDALAARGVDRARMLPTGYGETEPVASNETEEGRAQNRRTTFEWP